MPHQCLQCGHAFAEGSSALLQGCPQCKGTRFFYSAEPVPDEEREKLQSTQKDLRQVVTELLAESNVAELEPGPDGWAKLRPRDIRRLVKQAQAGQEQVTSDAKDRAEAQARRQAMVEEARARLAKVMDATEEKPDTVTIDEPGTYAIDVQGLLERDPIVVHRDGAYMIHLPSLFEKQSS